MSVRQSRPIRWFAGGAAALILTIYSAYVLGLNVPAVRAVPLAPWAGAEYGEDLADDAALDPAASSSVGAPPLRPARVAGVRVPRTPASPGSAGTATAPHTPPEQDDGDSRPAIPALPPLPVVPAIPQVGASAAPGVVGG